MLSFSFKGRTQELQATLHSSYILLQWKLQKNVSADHCEVQRRSRGGDFRTIALVLADNERDSASYSYKDKLSGSESFYYYRIRTVYNSGDEQYSDIVSMPVNTVNQELLTVEVKSSAVALVLLPQNKGSYLLRIYNGTGQLLYTRRAAAGSYKLPVQKLPKGMYFIEAFLPVNGQRYYGSFRK
jgi:hypothetical protein